MYLLALFAALSLFGQDDSVLDRCTSAAAVAMQSGDYVAAERNYQAIVRIRPNMAEAYVNLGLSLFLQRKYVEAIHDFDVALKLKPELANAKLFLGISHFKLNHSDPALSNLRQYASERPGDGEGQYYLGLAYLAVNKYSEAETALLAARSINPGNIDVLYHLTQIYLGQAAEDPSQRDLLARRYHDAVEEIAAIDPESYRLAQLRAGFYEVDGKKADAIRELETVLKQNPRSRGLHYTLGCLYTEAREYVKALAQFEAELKLDSPYPRTYLQLGHVYLALEKPAEALPVLERALKIEPESSGLVWVDIGRAYRLENRADEAARAFEQAIALGQAKASVYYQLAVAAKKSGNLTKSREALEMSQRLRREEQIAGPAGPQ